MIDQHGISISSLINVPLKKSGNYLIGACPMCGGTDRFNVKDDSLWLCRKCSPDKYRDAVALVMVMQNCDFKQAVQYLNLQAQTNTPMKPRNPVSAPQRPSVAVKMNDGAWLSDEWQAGALKLVCSSACELTKKSKAWQYLEARGLEQCVIHANSLGFIPEDAHLKWGEHEVFAYRGILIPWMMPNDTDKFYRLNMRLSPNDDRGKYKNIKGGTSQALYFASDVVPNKPVVMVEGEFDALVIASELVRYGRRTGRKVDMGVVATGSTTGGRTMRWLALLRMASKVLVAFDSDENKAGDEASKWWLEALPNAKRYAPTSHDVTDMWKSGHSIIDWLREGVMK